MNAKLSQHTFWSCLDTGLIMIIAMTPQNPYVRFSQLSFTVALTLILVCRREADFYQLWGIDAIILICLFSRQGQNLSYTEFCIHHTLESCDVRSD